MNYFYSAFKKGLWKYVLFCVVFTLGWLILCSPFRAYVDLITRFSGDVVVCELKEMFFEKGIRGSGTYYSVFVTENGTELTIQSSYQDYTGRRTELLMLPGVGQRKAFECTKLVIMDWMMLFFVMFSWVLLGIVSVNMRRMSRKV